MLLREITKALFADGPDSQKRSSDVTWARSDVSELVEPSPEIRAAVKRWKKGLPNPYEGQSNEIWTVPTSYISHPEHQCVSTRAGLCPSDAFIVTRFFLDKTEDAMSRLLGVPGVGRNVLDFQLGGLELAWQNDLRQALEHRTAIWSVRRLIMTSGDLVLEHIVVPVRTGDGQLAFVGWYHRIGGNLVGYPTWSEVATIEMKRRSERIHGSFGSVCFRIPGRDLSCAQETP